MNVSLTPQLEEFINEEVRSGRYKSASEVVRAGLRLIQLRDAKLEALRRDIQERLEPPLLEGLESGKAIPLTRKDVKKVRRTVETEITKQKK
jgi:antitoxin ParD1/3/4